MVINDMVGIGVTIKNKLSTTTKNNYGKKFN